MVNALAHRSVAFLFLLMPFDVNVVLRLSGGEGVFLAGLRDLRAGRNPRRRRGAQEIRIEARSRAHASAARAAEPEMERHGIIRVAGHKVDARIHLPPTERQRDVVARGYAE